MMPFRVLFATAFLIISSGAHADHHWRPTPVQQIIVDMSRADTLQSLGAIVRSTADRYQCQEMAYRRLGLMPDDGELYYVVRCIDGEEYTVRILRDAGGTTRVASCSLMKLVNADCDDWDAANFIRP